MRFLDLIRFAIGGLWRQKIRTTLTVLGVAVGACSLAFSLSLGVGLRRVITNEFHSRPGFWQVQVNAGHGRVAAELLADAVKLPEGVTGTRAGRLREMLEARERAKLAVDTAVPLTPQKLEELTALPDVEEVRTFRHYYGLMRLGDKSRQATFVATRCDRPEIVNLLVAGRVPQEGEAREVLVPEWLLYDLNVRTDAEQAAVLGRTLTVELGGTSDARQQSLLASLGRTLAGSLTTSQGLLLLKLLNELPKLIDHSSLSEVEKADLRKLLFPADTPTDKPGRYPAVDTFTIVGVYRAATADEEKRGTWHLNQESVFASASGGEGIFRRLHSLKDGRFDHAEVRVRAGGDLPGVVEGIEKEGFGTQSSLRWYNNARREVTAIAVGLNVFSWISLIIAAIGITNTLVTNVVERTREIGILKAIGASRRQILVLFLLEGTVIGTIGGALGLALARLGAGPADGLVKSEIQRQMRGETMLSSNVFEFPLWLSLATFGSAAIITTLAAIYPARRASRVEPIEALKYG
ncbi:ABC transporter permease [Limnoglobus roseus]|uniref:ABC efflux pump, inner membrane subunit n=1 Tax=Limnoglobus roseus TaxID=2598579 RepID=A0A5C1AGJ0_9BACT|nr:FtsX-like permease family protein [Limnoglobus roseus]QEL17267.1 ABC efflux pump, inner membrane subunit [Limnoglobus roseus]